MIKLLFAFLAVGKQFKVTFIMVNQYVFIKILSSELCVN
jgi:hypothetical protein